MFGCIAVHVATDQPVLDPASYVTEQSAVSASALRKPITLICHGIFLHQHPKSEVQNLIDNVNISLLNDNVNIGGRREFASRIGGGVGK